MIGRVLGIDLGMARTGLAISDELGVSVRALENLTPKSRAEDVAFLVALCREHDVKHVLVGVPPHGPMHKRSRGFAEALQGALGDSARVVCVDEDRSSIEASTRLVDSGTKKRARKAALDSESARGLVLAWLAAQPSTGSM